MPYVISGDGTKIYYEVIGRGEPLVLVQGFSWDLTAWHFQWELGYRFRLVLIDNRGVGLSDKPSGPYSLDSMLMTHMPLLASWGLVHSPAWFLYGWYDCPGLRA